MGRNKKVSQNESIDIQRPTWLRRETPQEIVDAFLFNYTSEKEFQYEHPAYNGYAIKKLLTDRRMLASWKKIIRLANERHQLGTLRNLEIKITRAYHASRTVVEESLSSQRERLRKISKTARTLRLLLSTDSAIFEHALTKNGKLFVSQLQELENFCATKWKPTKMLWEPINQKALKYKGGGLHGNKITYFMREISIALITIFNRPLHKVAADITSSIFDISFISEDTVRKATKNIK